MVGEHRFAAIGRLLLADVPAAPRHGVEVQRGASVARHPPALRERIQRAVVAGQKDRWDANARIACTFAPAARRRHAIIQMHTGCTAVH